MRFCPRGGRELMKFTAIHVDRSRGQNAVSEPVSCRGDPPPLKGKQLRHGGSPIRPAWMVLHKPAGWRATGSQTHSRAAAEAQTDNHYHSLPHRHEHDTRSPMLGVREADEYEIFDTRCRRQTAALLRNLLPPSTLC